MAFTVVLDARRVRDFGIGSYIRNLVRALAAVDAENRYVLVALPEGVEEFADLPANFRTVRFARPDTGLIHQISFSLFLRQFDADLFHLPLNVVPWGMPRPYVVTVHDLSSLLFPPAPDRWRALRLWRFRRGLMRAAQVLAVSGATRRDVERVLGIPPQRIRQIYDAPDPRFLRDGAPQCAAEEAERRRVLERYQVNYPYILYAGAIRPQKNVPRLVEAFAVLLGELKDHPVYKDLRLIIIGDEIARYPAVRHAVIKSRVEHAVRFLGFLPFETLRVFYQCAAVFAFPSLYEGFGLPPLEAMACGTPVVTSNVSSLPEVVGEAAVLVNPENVFDIARGLREALLNEALRRELTRRGFEQLRRFSWERTAREVLEVYREVVERSRRRG
jgi:glycosyltransferase involved in cell wall biosynthesis